MPCLAPACQLRCRRRSSSFIASRRRRAASRIRAHTDLSGRRRSLRARRPGPHTTPTPWDPQTIALKNRAPKGWQAMSGALLTRIRCPFPSARRPSVREAPGSMPPPRARRKPPGRRQGTHGQTPQASPWSTSTAECRTTHPACYAAERCGSQKGSQEVRPPGPLPGAVDQRRNARDQQARNQQARK